MKHKVIRGNDDNVIKFVFEVEGDRPAVYESVLYKYPTYKERTVMCISTQSGCPMGCTFCGTGEFFNRNATHEEILSQVSIMETYMDCELSEVDKLQIMVMSMGEPLLNMDAVSVAFARLYRDLKQAQLLVSTSAPRTKSGWEYMMQVANDIPTVGLQFSVHASSDEERDKLIPMKGKLSLLEISEKGRQFFELTGRKPFFNYCAHEGNSSDADVDRLESLFDPTIWEATISVICESDESMADAIKDQEDLVQEFSGKLLQRGYGTRVFNPAGQDDIGGGCGQLWQVQEWAKEHPEVMKQSAGNKCLERAA